jgi:hypothetical protein
MQHPSEESEEQRDEQSSSNELTHGLLRLRSGQTLSFNAKRGDYNRILSMHPQRFEAINLSNTPKRIMK